MILKRTTSENPHFVNLCRQLDAELKSRYGSTQEKYDTHNTIEVIDTVVIAYVESQPVGYGCFRALDTSRAELIC